MNMGDTLKAVALGMGKLAGVSRRNFGCFRIGSRRVHLRSIVLEELTRLSHKKNPSPGEIEKRLDVLTASIMAIQDKLAELSRNTPLGEVVIDQAMASVAAEDDLDDDEKSVLESIFKENIVLQKRKL